MLRRAEANCAQQATCGYALADGTARSPICSRGFNCKSTTKINPSRAHVCSSCPDGLLRRLLCICISLFLVCYLVQWHWSDRLSWRFVTSPLPADFKALDLDTVYKHGTEGHRSGAARNLTPHARTSCHPAINDFDRKPGNA